MPRVARIVLPGFPHHVTQRGNNLQDVFFVDEDRRVYLEILGEQAERYGVTVQGWCLMTNHVPQEQKESLRLNTHRGRPRAADRFLGKLETKLNRRLRPLPVGRPRKENNR